MQPPASRNQMDKLGKRLASEGHVLDEDVELYSAVIDYYQELLDLTGERLTAAGFEPTTRVKTTGTLVDKLRRESGIQLTHIQDLAGARIIVPTRSHQDISIALLGKLFAGDAKSPTVVDRRQNPSHGYRAVHVVVYYGGYPVEIQIRTELQNLWAQIFERLADQWGRQIRYGGEPDVPGYIPTAAAEGFAGAQRAVLSLLDDLSGQIELLEQARTYSISLIEAVGIIRNENARLADASQSTAAPNPALDYATTRQHMIALMATLIKDRRHRGRLIRRNLKRTPESPEQIIKVTEFLCCEMEKLVVDSERSTKAREQRVRHSLDAIARLAEYEGES